MLRDNYMWNKVFCRVMDIKDEYLKTHKSIDYNQKELFFELISNILDKTKREFYLNWFYTLKVTENKGKILLHYDLIQSMGDMLADENNINIEARSIYIDLINECIILCPMDKFFNIGETERTLLPTIYEKVKNSKVLEISEKLDGSNQNATYYNGEVILCGSTACDINNSWRIEEGYKILNSNEGYINMLKDNVNITFIFELIHPKDIHVIKYKEAQTGLYLLCYRNNLTGEISSYKDALELAKKYNILSTKTETYCFEELLIKKDIPSDIEGWVLNIDGERFKLKTKSYLDLRKLTYYDNNKLIKSEIINGTIDDFLANCPDELREIINTKVNNIFEYLKTERNIALKYLNDYKDIKAGKEFFDIVSKEVPKEYQMMVLKLKNNINYDFTNYLLKNKRP